MRWHPDPATRAMSALIRAAYPKLEPVIYAAMFDCGSIKIGRSESPANRLSSLVTQEFRRGAKMIRHRVFRLRSFPDSVLAEKRALKAMAEAFSESDERGEWFPGADWDIAIAVCKDAVESIPLRKKRRERAL